jgi:hypothetical protein
LKPKTEEEGDYWLSIATTARRHQCSRSTAKECTKRDECGCYVVDALGADALAAVLGWAKSQRSKKDLAARFGLAQSADLSALAEEVLAWGLALSPLLT